MSRRYKKHRSYNSGGNYSYSSFTNRQLVRAGSLALYSKGDRKSYKIKFIIEIPEGIKFRVGSGIDRARYPEAIKDIRKFILGKSYLQILEKIQLIDSKIGILESISTVRHGKENIPVIPGSTIKGAIRSKLELLLPEEKACFVIPKRGKKGSWRHRNVYNKPQPRLGDNQSLSRMSVPPEDQPYMVCVVCDMFGRSPGRDIKGFLSKFLFNDATYIEGTITQEHERAIQLIKGPAKFEFTVFAQNITQEELYLLLRATGAFHNEPVLMGYRKYHKGYGKTYFKLLSLEEYNIIDGIPKLQPIQTANIREAMDDFFVKNNIQFRKINLEAA